MKRTPLLYAQALAEVASRKMDAAEENKIVKNFLATVRKNGDERQLKKIVAAAEKLILRKSGAKLIETETARPIKNLRAALKNIASAHDVVREGTNSALVAGIKITIDDERQFDGSLARKLQKLFTPNTV